MTHLYIMQMAETGAFKIGRSKHPRKRLKQLQTGCPHKIRLILILHNKGDQEKALHELMKRYRTRINGREWFLEHSWGELPNWVYEQIPEEILEDINSDWWKKR